MSFRLPSDERQTRKIRRSSRLPFEEERRKEPIEFPPVRLEKNRRKGCKGFSLRAQAFADPFGVPPAAGAGDFAFSKKPRRFSNFKQKQLRRPELFFYICNVSISQFLLFLRLSFSAFQPYVPFCRSRPFRRPRRRIFCFFPKRTALFLLSCAPCFPAAAGYAILSKILM